MPMRQLSAPLYDSPPTETTRQGIHGPPAQLTIPSTLSELLTLRVDFMRPNKKRSTAI